MVPLGEHVTPVFGSSEQLYSNEVFTTVQPFQPVEVKRRILKIESDVDQLKRDVRTLEAQSAGAAKTAG